MSALEVFGTRIAPASVGPTPRSGCGARDQPNQEETSKMRSRLFLSLLGAVALLAASAAQAGTLTAATWTQVTQGFPMTRTGAQIGITGTGPPAPRCRRQLVLPGVRHQVLHPEDGERRPRPRRFDHPGRPADPHGRRRAWPAATMGVPGTVFVRTAIHNAKGVNQSTFMTRRQHAGAGAGERRRGRAVHRLVHRPRHQPLHHGGLLRLDTPHADLHAA